MMKVWLGSTSCLDETMKGGSMKTSFLIGIDVSKDAFSVGGIDMDGTERLAASCPMDAGGFMEFIRGMKCQRKDLDQIIVGMESTGCYHINLYSWYNPHP
jgi:hypothetical protein